MPELVDYLLRNVAGFREARLPSLYSDFYQQRISNPDGYIANCGVWLDALCNAARNGRLSSSKHLPDTLCLQTGAPLLQALETKQWGQPLALGAVTDEGLNQRRLIPYDEFISAKKSIYNRSWELDPRWFLSWAFRQLSLSKANADAATLPAKRFVMVQNVENIANIIHAKLRSASTRVDRIYPMASFKSLVVDSLGLNTEVSASDLAILLTYLSRDKGLVKYNSSVVVYRAEDDQPSEITQEELTIGSLKRSVSEMQHQCELLSNSINEMSEKARKAVEQKSRVVAISALRSKSLKTKILGQRTELLTQLEETLNSIEQATDQVTVVRLMKDSTNVLKNLNKEIGDAHNVQDITEQLKEETMKVEEVNEIIQDAGKENFHVDEGEIEQELEAILEESKSYSDNHTREALATLKTPQTLLPQPENLSEASHLSSASAIPTEPAAPDPV